MHLEPDRMRLDVPELSSAIIYRGDLDLVWIVDHRDQSFVRIDRATMDELSRRMAEAKAELRARLAAMSPELRAAMERMLGETAEPGAEEGREISVRETGRTQRLNDMGCAEVELRRGEETIAMACTADWESAAVEPETFRPIQELGSFLHQTLSVASRVSRRLHPSRRARGARRNRPARRGASANPALRGRSADSGDPGHVDRAEELRARDLRDPG